MILFAARYRAIRALFEGDPVAWVILAGAIAVTIVIYVVRARMGARD
jgi:hypothetical protein